MPEPTTTAARNALPSSSASSRRHSAAPVTAGKSQPTISHHTRVLAQAGLIEGDKRGKWTWWRIVPGRLAAVRQALGGT
jgi:DNA-binding transcriptional ArsR family regulator